MVPFYIGLTVLAIGICFGFNCGYAINPARDFAPRLFTGKLGFNTCPSCVYCHPAMSGWGLDVFSFYSQWWVVPILSTHVGGVLGAWLYYLAIGNIDVVDYIHIDSLDTELHWSKDDAEESDENDREVEADNEEAPQLPIKQDLSGNDRGDTYTQVRADDDTDF